MFQIDDSFCTCWCTHVEAHRPISYSKNILKINFRIDHKLIDAFYNQIQEANIGDLDVSFGTSLSDSLEKSIRLRLVQKAIEDARINATNISQTLGVRITKIKQVHKYGEMILDATKIEMAKFTPPVLKKDTEIRYSTAFDKFQVEDMELEETQRMTKTK